MPDGFILQPGYRVRDGLPVLQLFGRLAEGPAFLVEDDRIRPYFFAPSDACEGLRTEPHLQIEATSLVALDGTPLARLSPRLPSEVPRLRERLPRSLEADIRFPYRCLIDLGIRTSVSIRGEPERIGPELLRFANPELAPAQCRPPLRVLSLDLETTPDASRILSAALVGDGIDEVHLVAGRPVEGALVHPDERSLLEAAARRIREADPDILTGWNVVDFDLITWQSRARAHALDLQLGRIAGEVRFQQDPRFTRQSRASIPGRMVLDGIALLRDAVKLEDYRLETAARQLLGRGKLIDAKKPDAAEEIQRLWREDPEALVAYNREDARLVLDILAHEDLISLCVERSLLSGMQLDRVGASVASFDLLYLPLLRERGMVAESVDSQRENVGVRGGAVLDSRPGLFENVAVYDFKSLYPSLIRTFNLDPLAHARAGAGDIEAPNGARFSRESALL
ncbi:MAG: 3'-5' exonuclease, partial [Myxococcota bacterium]